MKNFISILFLLCFLILPNTAFADQVYFQPAQVLDRQASPFTTTLVLNTEGDSINTIQGTLKVDSKLAGDIQISDSGSIVTFWITKPEWNKNEGLIHFAGAVPGGYNGGSGILFSIILPPYSGQTIDKAISVIDLQAYKNDGVATSANISKANFSLGDVAGDIDQGIADQLYINGLRKDDIQPEDFNPQVSRDANIFGGKWFVTFSTTDKQSGIDHYEVQETKSGALDSGQWKVATSPYELTDQNLNSFIYVIAIDRQGNEKIIKVFPRNPLSWTQLYGLQIAIITLLLVVSIGLYYRRDSFVKNKNV